MAKVIEGFFCLRGFTRFIMFEICAWVCYTKTMEQFKEIQISDNLEKLANKLKSKAELFIVGGYVRNSLLGIGGTDIDLCSKLTPDKLKSILKDTNFVVKDKNKKLGTVTISIGTEVFEHTTFRTEEYDASGKHSPVSICFVDDIRQDAKRRDFTVNCIYYSIVRKKIIDIYSGLYDLKKRRIKTIETPEFVFSKDGLRILRMVRIACELNFKIESETYKTAKNMSYYLKDISGARKQKELIQILNAGTKYSVSKSTAHLRALEYFNSMNLWTSFYSTVSKIRLNMIKKSTNYMCALLIDMIDSINPDCVEYYLKYMLSGKGLDFTQKQQDYLINVVCGYFDALNRINNKKYFIKYYENFDEISKFIAKKNIFLYKKYNFFYKYISNYNIPIQVKDLKVNGDDIKKYNPKLPQKYYSQLLKELINKVFDGEIKNTKEDLIMEIKNYDYRNN